MKPSQDYMYPNALHFQFDTSAELYDLYATVLEHSADTIIIEIWCLQSSLFNIRAIVPCSCDVAECIKSFVCSHVRQKGFECDIVL